MTQSRTEEIIDLIAILTSFVIYFVIWISFPSLGFEEPLILPALGVALIYVGMLVYEMKARGHFFLSADSTALPVTFVLTILGSLTVHFMMDVRWRDIFTFIFIGLITWMVAHLAALVYSGLVIFLMRLCFRRRIASEKTTP